GTSRDRTLQAGKLLLIDLSDSEKNAEVKDLTPLVPGDRVRAPNDVGRYYDAEPIGDPADQRFLVSWSGGPVESEALAMGKTKANFGLYVVDTKPALTGGSEVRYPIYDDPGMWDVLARPVKSRPQPVATQSPVSGT